MYYNYVIIYHLMALWPLHGLIWTRTINIDVWSKSIFVFIYLFIFDANVRGFYLKFLHFKWSYFTSKTSVSHTFQTVSLVACSKLECMFIVALKLHWLYIHEYWLCAIRECNELENMLVYAIGETKDPESPNNVLLLHLRRSCSCFHRKCFPPASPFELRINFFPNKSCSFQSKGLFDYCCHVVS